MTVLVLVSFVWAFLAFLYFPAYCLLHNSWVLLFIVIAINITGLKTFSDITILTSHNYYIPFIFEFVKSV